MLSTDFTTDFSISATAFVLLFTDSVTPFTPFFISVDTVVNFFTAFVILFVLLFTFVTDVPKLSIAFLVFTNSFSVCSLRVFIEDDILFVEATVCLSILVKEFFICVCVF